MSPDQRRYNSLRLDGYDYSESGAYFVTATVYQRQNLFGNLTDGEVKINQVGQIADQIWSGLTDRFPTIRLDVYCIMPDHMHGMVIIDPPTNPEMKIVTLSDVVRTFKSLSAFQINKARGTPGQVIWQRGYYDRIIRNEEEYENIKAYILENPYR